MGRKRIATLGSGLLLGASLVVAGAGFAEDAPEAAAGKTFQVDTTRSKTANEDGSTTYDRTKTVTNTETGKSATHTGQTTVTPTESGRAFDHTGTSTGPNGGVRTRHTTGSRAQSEDGTRTWGSTTDGSATGPKGRTRDWTTERGGSSTPNAAGGRDWQSNATRTGTKGRTWSRDSSGSTWHDGNGNRGGSRQTTFSGPGGAKQRNAGRRR
jgi:hypothetical protein